MRVQFYQYHKGRVSWLVRVLLVLVIYQLSLSTSSAQVGEYRTDFAVGFNGGMVISTIGFVPDVPQKQLKGMTGGLTFRYTCEKYFKSICSIVAEVNIAQTGWQEDIRDINNEPVYYASDTQQTTPLYYERQMTYFQVPLMARMGWGRERRGFQAFLQLGPQLGFFMNEKTNTNVIPNPDLLHDRSSTVVAQDSMAVENKLDYGIVVGAGLEFSRPKFGHVMLEARYYYGLGNIFGNSKSDFFGKSNFGQIVIKATYLFDIVRTKNEKIK